MQDYVTPQLLDSYHLPSLCDEAIGFHSCTGNEGNGPNPGVGCGEDHSPV